METTDSVATEYKGETVGVTGDEDETLGIPQEDRERGSDETVDQVEEGRGEERVCVLAETIEGLHEGTEDETTVLAPAIADLETD